MKTDQIFIGNIRKCTKYDTHTIFSSSTYVGEQCIGSECFGYIDKDDELYKEDAVLVKIKNGGYVDLESFNSLLDYIRIYCDITKNGYILGGLMMPTSAYRAGGLFVDKDSLRLYYADKEQTSSVSVRKLKKQVEKNNR